MSTQISLQIPDVLLKKAKSYTKKRGYESLQEFIRELIRNEVLEEPVGGKYTALASEASLGKIWNRKEEDEAWAHLQKKT